MNRIAIPEQLKAEPQMPEKAQTTYVEEPDLNYNKLDLSQVILKL